LPPRTLYNLAGQAVLEDVADGAGMVGHVQPVASLQAIAVERQLLVVDGVGDEERDQLLRVVVRPVRVGPASDHDVHGVRDEVGAHQQFTGGLCGGVWRARLEPVILATLAGLD